MTPSPPEVGLEQRNVSPHASVDQERCRRTVPALCSLVGTVRRNALAYHPISRTRGALVALPRCSSLARPAGCLTKTVLQAAASNGPTPSSACVALLHARLGHLDPRRWPRTLPALGAIADESDPSRDRLLGNVFRRAPAGDRPPDSTSTRSDACLHLRCHDAVIPRSRNRNDQRRERHPHRCLPTTLRRQPAMNTQPRTQVGQHQLLPQCSQNSNNPCRRRSPAGAVRRENGWCAILDLNQ